MFSEALPESILHKAISAFTSINNVKISIHDSSGILFSNPLLHIPHEYQNHTSCFCQKAKTTASGLRFCLRCKAASLKKAIRIKERFIGQCYLGLTEIIKPVFINDKLCCIIFVGNLFLEGSKANISEKIERICKVTGIDSKLLTECLPFTEQLREKDIKNYYYILDVLEHIIRSSSANVVSKKKSVQSSPIFCSTTHWAIESIQNYIFQFYNKDLKLSQLAKLYFLNPQYLCRLFHKETGMSFSEYINFVRINEAKQLLKLTNNDVMDISIKVGYCNVTYFNRLFKKNTGLTPREYRSIHAASL